MNVAACHNAFVVTLAAVTIAFAAGRSDFSAANDIGANPSGSVAAHAWADGGDTSVPSALASLSGHSASDDEAPATF